VPAKTGGSRPVLVSEGDSISINYPGDYTGMYEQARPGVEHHGLAVGGSSVETMAARAGAVRALSPKVLTVLIGANDALTPPSAGAFVDELFAYTDAMRAAGIKVAVGTILPEHLELPNNPNYTARFNARRAEINAALRRAVGTRIDAVIDFAADPIIGPDSAAMDTKLFQDGVHPTSCGPGCGGQGRMAQIYAPVVDALLGC
jgi:lysophospholipase L1-like esterase